MSETATPALDAPELSISDYRAMREGRSVERAAAADTQTSEAPPAPPADAESAGESETPDDSVEETQDSDGKEQQEQGDKKPGQKRGLVDEVIKLRRENRELKTRGAPPPQAEQTKPAPPAEPVRAASDDPEPDINKYSDYDKFNRDLVRWEIRRSQREAAEAAQRIEAQNAQQERMRSWQERMSAAAVEMSDFEAVALNTSLPVTQTMGDAIMGSDVGPKVLYHLGSHPAEAQRIAKLSPIDQIREIGKLEVKLSPPDTPASDENELPQKQAISKAPAPIPRPAGSGAKSTPTLKSLEGISQAEYRALRESGRLR